MLEYETRNDHRAAGRSRSLVWSWACSAALISVLVAILSGCCSSPGPNCSRVSGLPWKCDIACACPAWGCDPCTDRPAESFPLVSAWDKQGPECPTPPAGSMRLAKRGSVNSCTESIGKDGHQAPPSMPLRLAVRLDPQRDEKEFLAFVEEANRRHPRPMGQNMDAREAEEIQKRFGLPDASYAAVERWLTSRGMKVIKVNKYYDSHEVCVDTSVADAERAFAIRIFQSADNKLYTNICSPAVPAQPPIFSIGGLNNYPTPGYVNPSRLAPCQ